MQTTFNTTTRRRRLAGGFSLIEVVIALAILGLVFLGLVDGYRLSARRAEWSAYSLAAQALNMQQMEQIRAAKWDTVENPVVDETTQVPTTSWATLDLPISGTNVIRATNYVTVTPVAMGGGLTVKFVRVDTVWPWFDTYVTNSAATFRAPDR